MLVALAGMDPMRFLSTTDPFEANVMLAIAERRVEVDGDIREDQAVRTISTLGKAFGGG